MKNFAKFWIALFSLMVLCAPKRTVDACLWTASIGEETQLNRFFNPANVGEPLLGLQFLSPHRLHFGQYVFPKDSWISTETDSVYRKAIEEKGRNQNVREWFEYCKAKVSKKDLYQWLYQYPATKFFEKLEEDTLLMDGHSLSVIANQKKELRRYLILAKKVELHTESRDPWEEKGAQDVSVLHALAIEANKGLQNTRDEFIRIRTAYQLLKIYQKSQNYEDMLRVFSKYIPESAKRSCIYWWASVHKARALAAKRTQVEADLWWAKIYMNAPEKREVASLSFSGENIQASLKLAQNLEDKIAIYSCKAFSFPGRSLPYLLEIIRLDPSCREAELHFSREVNKAEEALLSSLNLALQPWHRREGYEKRVSEDSSYLKKLFELGELQLHNVKVVRKAFWGLGTSYLASLTGQYAEADAILNSLTPADTIHAFQKKLNQMINLALGPGRNKAGYEDSLYRNIRFLERHSKKYRDLFGVRDAFLRLLSWRYKTDGQETKAALCFALSNQESSLSKGWRDTRIWFEIKPSTRLLWYLNKLSDPTAVGALRNLYNKGFKTPFELYLLDRVVVRDVQLADWEGSLYFRNNDLEKACQVWGSIPQSYWQEKGSPYWAYLHRSPSCADIPHLLEPICNDLPTEGKWMIAQSMLKWRNAGNQDSLAVKSLIKLAHSWFNVSWYGNSWIMCVPMHSAREVFELDMQFSNRCGYYSLELARSLYHKASFLAKDPETRARCLAWAGRCEYLTRKVNLAQRPELEKKTWGQLTYGAVQSRFSKLPWYQQELMPCTTFQEFLKQSND